ncbi:MAG: hypothetical protein V8S53_00255 [Lachnospiraceae bacterium]
MFKDKRKGKTYNKKSCGRYISLLVQQKKAFLNHEVTLGDYSKDENGKNKTTGIEIPITMIANNKLDTIKKTKVVAATCEKDGNVEY